MDQPRSTARDWAGWSSGGAWRVAWVARKERANPAPRSRGALACRGLVRPQTLHICARTAGIGHSTTGSSHRRVRRYHVLQPARSWHGSCWPLTRRLHRRAATMTTVAFTAVRRVARRVPCAGHRLRLRHAGQRDRAAASAARRTIRSLLFTVGALLLAACAPQYEEVHVVHGDSAPPTVATEVVAYEDFDDGTRVEVVTYVHGEVEPVTVYPSIVWAGRVYYNVGGHFVHFSPSCDCWVYYRAPPPPLVVVWNQAYPTYPFVWVHGHVGPVWHWGRHVHRHPPPPRPSLRPNPPSHGGPGTRPGGRHDAAPGRPAAPGAMSPRTRPGAPRPARPGAGHGGARPPTRPAAPRGRVGRGR